MSRGSKLSRRRRKAIRNVKRRRQYKSEYGLQFEQLEARALLASIPAVSIYESEVVTPVLQDVGAGWKQVDALQTSFTLDEQRTVEVSGIANAITASGQEIVELRLVVDGVAGSVIQTGMTSYGQELQYPGVMNPSVEPVGIVSAGYGDSWNLLFAAPPIESSAALFSGSGIQVPHTSALSIQYGGSFTIEAWINPATYTNYYQTIARKWDASGAGEYFLALQPNDGRLTFRNYTGGSAVGGAQIPLNQWSHVAAVVQNGGVSLYLNGSQIGGAGINPAFNSTSDPFEIGVRAGTPENFAGMIDEVAVYNTAVSQGVLQSHFNTPDAQIYEQLVLQSNPVGFWRLDDAAGSTIAVDIANGLNGSVTGSVQFGQEGALITQQPSGSDLYSVFSTIEYAGVAHLPFQEFLDLPAGQHEIAVQVHASNQVYLERVELNALVFNLDTATYQVSTDNLSLTPQTGGWEELDQLRATINLDVDGAVNVQGALSSIADTGIGQTQVRLVVDGVAGPVIQTVMTSYGQELQYPGVMNPSVEPVGIVSAGYGDSWNLLFAAPPIESSAALFSGSGIQVPHTSALSIQYGGSFTIEAWINPATYTNYYQTIARKWDASGAGEYFLALQPNDGRLTFRNYTGGSAVGGAQIPLNQWSHVAAVVQNGGVSLYLNGSQIGGAGINPAFNSTSDPFEIGVRAGTPENFAGMIDEVAVYNTAVSQGVLQSHFNTPDAQIYEQLVLQSNPVGFWRLDDAAGSTIAVDIANGLNGSVTGSVQFGQEGALITQQPSGSDLYSVFSTIEYAGVAHLPFQEFLDLPAGQHEIAVQVFRNSTQLSESAELTVSLLETSANSFADVASIDVQSSQTLSTSWQDVTGLIQNVQSDGSPVEIFGGLNVQAVNGQSNVELQLIVDGAVNSIIQTGMTSYGQELQYPGVMNPSVEPVGIVSAGYGDSWNLLFAAPPIESSAALFSGSGIQVPHTSALSIQYGGSFTIEAWINPATYTNYYQTIARKWDASGAGEYFLALQPNDGRLTFRNYTGGSAVGGAQIPLNQWSHVAAVVQNGGVSLYLNGSQIGGAGINPAFNSTSDPFEIGVRAGTPENFAGMIDEVAVYNTAVSQGVLQSHFNTPDAQIYEQLVLQSNPVGFWRLDDAAGSTIAVDIANGLNGSVTGSVQFGQEGALITQQPSGSDLYSVFSTIEYAGVAHLPFQQFLDLPAGQHEIRLQIRSVNGNSALDGLQTFNTVAFRQINSEATPSSITLITQLRDSTDQPLAGVHNIGFGLFDSATGGTPIWSASVVGVNVSEAPGGYFQQDLLDLQPLTTPISTPVFLEITVDGFASTQRIELDGQLVTTSSGTTTLRNTFLSSATREAENETWALRILGNLRELNDSPVIGAVNWDVQLFDSSTGGSALFAESGTFDATDTLGGAFGISLGDNVHLDLDLLSTNPDLWAQLIINGESVPDRIKIDGGGISTDTTTYRLVTIQAVRNFDIDSDTDYDADTLNVWGMLQDSQSGQARTGTYSVEFSLFDSATAGTELFSETAIIDVVDSAYGSFVYSLGLQGPLDFDLFRDNPDLWLEFSVDGQVSLAPRTSLRTAAFFSVVQFDGNDAPIAVDDIAGEVTIGEDAGAIDITTAVLANDSDPDGDAFTITAINDMTTLGVLSLVAGVLTYDPNGELDYLADGETALQTFTYTIEDPSGESDTATVTITINGVNDAPVASAGGPYVVNEGESWIVDGSASTDPDSTNPPANNNDIVLYEWDLDYDGTFNVDHSSASAVSTSPVFSDDFASRTIALRVTDSAGATSIATTTLHVDNVAPTLEVSGNTSVDEGSTYTLNLSSSDPGDDTISSWFIDWGDGSDPDGVGGIGEVVSGNPTSVDHTYVDGTTIFTILATATDEDGTYNASATGGNAYVSVDPSFGDNGEVTADFFGSTGDFGTRMVQQPDGKIVIAGYLQGGLRNVGISRYETDGTLDTSFGDNGRVITDLNSSEDIRRILIDDQGRLIVAGNFGIARYFLQDDAPNSIHAGDLDASFGSGGLSTLFTGILDLKKDSLERLVAMRSNYLQRFNQDGSVDLTFNGGSQLYTYSLLNNAYAQALAIDADDNIVIAGYRNVAGGPSYIDPQVNNPNHSDIVVGRITEAGSLDDGADPGETGFGSNGLVSIDFDGRNDRPNFVGIDQGQIIIVGSTDRISNMDPSYDPNDPNDVESLTTDVAVIRLSSDGSLDTTFGVGGPEGDGLVQINLPYDNGTTIYPSNDYANALDITDNHEILIGGQFYTRAWIRLDADGVLDSSLGAVPYANRALSSISSITAIEEDTNGNILVGGYAYGSGEEGWNFAVARHTADGNVDTANFGVNGIVQSDFQGSTADYVRELVVSQADGSMIVAGYKSGGVAQLVLAKYQPDGTLDPTFGATDSDGIDGMFINTRVSSPQALAVDFQGRILVAYSNRVYRYLPDGSIDTDFGNTGLAYISLNWIDGLTIDDNGDIVAVGYSYDYGLGGTATQDAAITKIYSEDDATNGIFAGNVDTSFGVNGITRIDLGSLGNYSSGTVVIQNGVAILTNNPWNMFDAGSLLRVGGNVFEVVSRSGNQLTLDTNDPMFNTPSGTSSTYDLYGGGERIFGDGTIEVASGVLTITGATVPWWLGDGDQVKIDNVAFTIASRDSDTQVTLDDHSVNVVAGHDYRFFSTQRSDETFYDVRVDGNQIVASGYSRSYDFETSQYRRDSDFLLARFDSDGTLDSNFGTGSSFNLSGIETETTDGLVLTDINGHEYGYALVIDAGGNYVVGGDRSMARYATDGTLDTNFGTGGKLILSSPQEADTIAIDSDGRIVTAGSRYLSRFNADGSPDTDFAPGGYINLGDRYINTVAIDQSGRIVVGGYVNSPTTGADFFLSRYVTGGLAVTVNNVAPQNVAIQGLTTSDPAPTTANEADTIHLSGTATDPAGTYDPLTYTWSVTRNGLPFLQTSGQYISFTAADQGTYVATMTVSDGDGGSVTTTHSIAVANLAPTADDDIGNVSENGAAITIGVLTNDSDPAGAADPLTVTGVNTTNTIGSVSYSSSSVTYDPNGQFENLAEGETTTDSFTYSISDGDGGTHFATVVVTITGTNDGPIAQNVSRSADEDGATVNGNFDADDVDSDDDPGSLVYSITSSPSEGSVINNGDGTFTFDPGTDFQDLAVGETRDVSFEYTATDSHGAVSNSATITITVTGTNDDPIAQNVSGSADEDGATVNGNFNVDDVDSDDDASSLTYDITSSPSEGSVINNGDGTFTFYPGTDFQDLALGETRDVAFDYTATDSHGAVSNSATVTITVTGTNDGPIAQNVDGNADEDGATVVGNFDADDVDSDDDPGSLVYSITSSPSEGSVINNGDGSFTFDPGTDFQDLALGETRDVSFEYTATDSHGAVSNTATITITVTGTNDDPIAQNVSGNADEDGATLVGNFDADDIDSDDNPGSLTYDITTTPGEGSVINNGDGTFTFDPGTDFQDLAAGETRDVTFEYTATDSHGEVSNSATVTITVTGTNDGPIAQNVAGSADEDGATVIGNFDADDVDSDDDPGSLVYDITSSPSEGSVINNGDGSFTFDPGTNFQDLAAGETRDVTFEYTATDSHNAVSNTATVTITVTGVNDDPIALDVSGSADEDGAPVNGNFDADDIDSDDNPASLVYAITSSPSEGSVINNNDGSFTFDPGTNFQDLAAGETRDVTFEYTATDSHNAVSNTATVTITVTGVNDDPIALGVSGSADEDGAPVNGNFDADDIDSDDNPASLVYAITSSPSEGSVINNNDGSFTFDPGTDFQDLAAGETRDVTFDYTATDSHGAVSNSATVTITVTGVNDDPIAQNVSGSADEDGATVDGNFDADDVDSDDNPVSLVYDITSAPSEGSVVNNNDGSFTFDPGTDFQDLAAGETRDVTFEYTATDSHNAVSNTATVTITVTGVNDDPIAQNVSGSADEDGATVNGNFDADDIDSDDDPVFSLVYDITSAPSEGSVTNNGDGSFTFDPGTDFQDLAPGETRDVTFDYTATDQHGAISNTANVTITVTGVNDDPIAQNVSGSADEDGATVDGNFDADDVDSDDNPVSLVYDITSAPSEGSVVNNNDGSFTFDPGTDFQDLAAGETRDVTFEYTATDSHNAVSNTATVTITVTGVNDDPIAQNVSGSADEDGAPVNGNFDADDIDSDDDPASLVYAITSSPTEGSVVNNNDGSFTFDPGTDFQDLAAGETRDVTFGYTATDSHNAVSNTATVTITVTGVNDDPIAQDVSGSADEDGTSVIGSFDADDIDSDDYPASLTYTLTSSPSEGSVINNNDGSFTFDPGTDFQDLAAGETRDVTFDYTATDQHGAISNAATVTITVTGVNDDPIAQNVSGSADEDGATVNGNFDADDIDSDDDPNTLVYSITSSPSEGSVVNNGDGTFTFDSGTDFQDLAAGETRDVSFDYTATDSHGAISNTATVTITVTGTNDDPIAQNVSGNADEDGATVDGNFDADDVDSDDEPSSLVYSITSSPSEGSVVNNGDGTFTFDPGTDFQDLAAGETRDVTFDYTATDSHGAISNTATVTITVTGVNDDPVAQNVSGSADEDGATVNGNFDADDVDSDDDPASLVYDITSAPSEGSVVNNNDGSFTFDPGSDFQDLAAGETRDVTFDYTATDQHGAISNSATVTITVTGVNDDPIAQNVSGNADEDGATVDGSFDADDVDSDDEPSSLVYSITSSPSEGSVVNNGDGTFTFDPGTDFQDLAAGETRDVSFEYTATDSHGAVSNTATVTITVTGTNDDPIAQNVSGNADEDGATVDGNFDADDVDSDDEPSSLVYSITSSPSEGSVVNNGDGTFTFDPGTDFQDLAAGETRDVAFDYTATDSHGAISNTATVTITVTGVNDDPIAQNVSGNADEDGATVDGNFDADDVDSDDDSSSLVYSITSSPSEGSVVNNGDGTFTFDPGTDLQDLAAGETRDVSFEYTATDSHGAVSNTATVTITVTGTNDDPLISDGPDSDSLAETNAGLSTSGSMTVSDVDTSDSVSVDHSLVVSGTSDRSDPAAPGDAALEAMLTLTPTTPVDGTENSDSFNWDFNSGSEAFDYLAAGETLILTYTITATDSQSATDTETVTITITGTNDDPVITEGPDSDSLAETNAGLSTSGSMTVSDVDTSDSVSVEHSLVVSGTSDRLDPAAPSDAALEAMLTLNPTTPVDGTENSDSFNWNFNSGGEAFDYLSVGDTLILTYTITASDSQGATDTETVTVTIIGTNNAPVAEVPDVETQNLQYSDQIQDITFEFSDVDSETMTAVVSYSDDGGASFQSGLPDSGTLEPGIGLSFAGSAAANTSGYGSNGSWTVSGIADLAPGNYIIRVTATDDQGESDFAESEIIVNQEDAVANYSGMSFASTPSVNNDEATVELRATIEDITAAFPSGTDLDAGHIIYATVSFFNYNGGSPVPIAEDLPVTLVHAGDQLVGIASYSWVVDIGNQDSETFEIIVKVNSYYTYVESENDITLITVSKPESNAVTGGGYIINESSAGVYAGDDGLRTNYGFNIKTNRRGTNVQGHVNIIVRQDGKIYQIKTNATNSLVAIPPGPGDDPNILKAEFSSKANLKDITDPNNPISLGGNLQLLATVTDAGEPGTLDLVGFTLWDGSTLLYSSNWDGTITMEQLIDGGNIQIRLDAPGNMRLAAIRNPIGVRWRSHQSASIAKCVAKGN